MKLTPTILPAKVGADGKHRIRIAMSHRGTMRYFMTRFYVDTPNCIHNGSVSGIPNASYINQQLLKQMNDIYKAFDQLEDTDYLTCSQLLSAIEDKIKGAQPITLRDAYDQYLQNKIRSGASEASVRIITTARASIMPFFKEDYFLKQLDTITLFNLRDYLVKQGLNSTTQFMYLSYLRSTISFAVRHRLVEFDVLPFRDFDMPKSIVRQVGLTIEQLRVIRDTEFTGMYKEQMEFTRDLFMLSFFLCGMNLVDIMRLDFSGETIRFLRQKTERRRPVEQSTEFTIQPEARALLDKLMRPDGIYYKQKGRTYCSLTRMMNRHLKNVAEQCSINQRIIYYSARKTFAQLANELMIKDSIIEYCIGDSVSTASKTIGSYIHINRRMADVAIRKVFDAVASTKTMDELLDDFGV